MNNMNIAPDTHLGEIRSADGKLGKWELSSFEITEKDAVYNNVNCERIFRVEEGHYRRLMCDGNVVMSNTAMEIKTNQIALRKCGKRNLITGLGMGMILHAILKQPHVEYVRVLEKSRDVIELIGKDFLDDKRVEIIHADAFEYNLKDDEQYDFIWHDIWTFITSDNLLEMKKLGRKYKKACADNQEFWAKDICRSLHGTLY